METKLTDKQARFVQEYLLDLNATRAAERAGYSQKTAYAIGHDLLKKPEIQAALQAAMAERARRTEISQDRVLREYARIAFFDPRRLFGVDGGVLPVSDWDDDVAAVVAALDVAELGSGGDVVGMVKKLKLADKKGALDSLARHLGMFTDKQEIRVADVPRVVVELSGGE